MKTRKSSYGFSLKPLAFIVAGCFSVGQTFANPLGPQVVAGSAAFATQGNVLSITNTPGAIINWQAFSIDKNEITRFNQASSASSVLNRVVGSDPSQLLGHLQSNGRVFLINPAGILVGAGAMVDTAGFVASTLNLSNADFLAGKLNFTATPGAGKVENYGSITTPSGGAVYLVGERVENHGIINAPNGEVLLAAGKTAYLLDTGTPGVRVEVTADEQQALNLGQILADSGRIGMVGAIVKHGGRLSASSVTSEGGRVFLKATQDAYVEGAGRIDATGSQGGEVHVLGNRVALTNQASIDASGTQGGGTILVGGDYQGENVNVQNAITSNLGKDVVLTADAIEQGKGGKIVVWADETAQVAGNISAKGGAQGGDGGFVETSGKRRIDFSGVRVDASADYGKAGLWLIDPDDLNIDAGGASALVAALDTGGSGTDVTVTQSSGSYGSVNTSGTGLIEVNSGIVWTKPSQLTLQASNGINIYAPITNAAGALKLEAGSGGIMQSVSGVITTDKLAIVSPANVSLNGAPNKVNTFSADMQTPGPGTANLSFSNDQSLIIGSAGGVNGIITGENQGYVSVKTTTGDLTVAQPVDASSGAFPSATIKLEAAGTMAVNTAITSSMNGDPTGVVALKAGSGGIAGTGVIKTGSLDLTSGGSVSLTGANVVGNNGVTGVLAASVTSGGLSFKNAASFTVGTVGPTIGIVVPLGDVLLEASGIDSLLTVSQNVTAATGNVTYVADNLAHNAFTTTSGSFGKYAKVHPATAATAIEFSAAADAPGLLRLSSTELDKFSTPMLKVGGNSHTGSITVKDIVAPSAFSKLSLITAGSITQTAGNTISIGYLNADGYNGVTLNEANEVTKLGGHTTTGNFAFTDATGITVAQTDPLGANGVESVSGSVALVANNGSIDRYGTAIVSTSGSLSATATSGINLPGANSAASISLSNVSSGNVLFEANRAAIPISASNGGAGGSLSINNMGGTLEVGVAGVTTSGGAVSLSAAGNVSLIGAVSTGGGAVNITSTGGSISENHVGTDISSGAGAVSLTASSGIGASGNEINIGSSAALQAQTTSGDIYLSSTANMLLNLISAPGGIVTLVAGSGSIADGNASAINISANMADLSSYSGIGSGDPLETQVTYLKAVNGMGGGIAIDNAGALITHDDAAISTAGDISLVAHSPLTIGALGVVSTSNGNITLTAGASGAGATGDILTINGPVSTSGSIVLNAGNSIVGTNVPTGANVTQNANLNPPAGGGGGAVPPTVDQCVATPTLSGCTTVLPTLATCTATPSAAGCSAVLPSLATCTTTPSAAGCSAVLPTLATCTATPSAEGCSAVLPTLATCTVTPSAAGCSTVLPTLATCTATPSAAGCSAVLPTLATCTTTPSAAGCSAVLPTLVTCTATPSAAGCSVVLPTLADCTANPSAAGCAVVQPTLATCAADPNAAGCSTVLPEIATCLTAPSMPGCAEGTSGEASFVVIAEQIQTGQNQTVNAIDEVQPPTSDGPVALPVELASVSPMLATLSGGTPTLIGGVVGGEMPNTFGFVASDSNSSGTVSGERDQETATNGNGAGSQAAASESGSEENGGRGRRNVGQCTI